MNAWALRIGAVLAPLAAEVSTAQPPATRWNVAAAGAVGDGRHLKDWHGAERGPPPYRWSLGRSQLILPAPADRACTLELDLVVPAHAVGPESGLYLDGARVATLAAGTNPVARLPAATGGLCRVELR
jgi:hypothetical protein